MLLTLQNVVLFYNVKGSNQDKVDKKKVDISRKTVVKKSRKYVNRNTGCLIYSLLGKNDKLIRVK